MTVRGLSFFEKKTQTSNALQTGYHIHFKMIL
jgi:hypothetical protein